MEDYKEAMQQRIGVLRDKYGEDATYVTEYYNEHGNSFMRTTIDYVENGFAIQDVITVRIDV